MKKSFFEDFSTSDMGLAITLLALDKEMVGIDRSSKRAEFIFKEDESLGKFKEDYFNHKLRIDPLKFWNNSKMLKARLYDN